MSTGRVLLSNPGRARHFQTRGKNDPFTRCQDHAYSLRVAPHRTGWLAPRHMDHYQGNAVGSYGVKLVAAPGAPPSGQVLARHLPRSRLHGRLWPMIPCQFFGPPLPLRLRGFGMWHEEMRQDPRFRRASCALPVTPGSRPRAHMRGWDIKGQQYLETAPPRSWCTTWPG